MSKCSPKFACMELMWGGVADEKFEPWLREIHSLGFAGVGCREKTLQPFIENPAALKQLLNKYKLELAVVYSELHFDFVRYQKLFHFVQAMGCVNLCLHGGRGGTSADRELFARVLDHIGGMAATFGLKAMFHHHTDTFSETMEQTEHVLKLTNPKNFYAFCDVGHATKDFIEVPVRERARTFLERNWDRIAMIEFKDCDASGSLSIEVGQGQADYASVFSFIDEHAYNGWIVFEQNSPNNNKTPLECARGSFDYVKKHFKPAHALAAGSN